MARRPVDLAEYTPAMREAARALREAGFASR
jgi:hypothetical protein